MNLGSFVHRILEEAVKLKVKIREQMDAVFSDLAREDEWKDVDIKRVKPMLDVFRERNRDRIWSNLMVDSSSQCRSGASLQGVY